MLEQLAEFKQLRNALEEGEPTILDMHRLV